MGPQQRTCRVHEQTPRGLVRGPRDLDAGREQNRERQRQEQSIAWSTKRVGERSGERKEVQRFSGKLVPGPYLTRARIQDSRLSRLTAGERRSQRSVDA